MAEVQINRKLNLVVPVEVRPGVTYYVHATPIMRETFETYYGVIAKTFTEIYAKGLSVSSGPRVAALMLRDVAKAMGQWEGAQGVEQGLMAEIRRLSNVVAPANGRWTTLPFEDALQQKIFDEDDLAEVENAVAFFTVASAMHKKAQLRPVLEATADLWGAQLTSSNATDFAASLPTLTSAENTGAKATPSSIPS